MIIHFCQKVFIHPIVFISFLPISQSGLFFIMHCRWGTSLYIPCSFLFLKPVRKLKGKMLVYTPRCWWEGNIETVCCDDLEWIHVTYNRSLLQTVVSTIINLQFPKNKMNFLTVQQVSLIHEGEVLSCGLNVITL